MDATAAAATKLPRLRHLAFARARQSTRSFQEIRFKSTLYQANASANVTASVDAPHITLLLLSLGQSLFTELF